MRLFLLKREGESVPTRLKIKVISNLNSFADNDISFEEFSSLKDMFGGLSGALKSSEFIVIAVTAGIYNKTKLKLMSALSLKTEENKELAEKLSKLGLEEEKYAQNVKMPEKAVVFPTEDGTLSGFLVKKGKQQIALIPLAEDYTDYAVKRGLVPYLTSGSAPKAVPAKPEKSEPEKEKKPQKIAFTQNEKEVALRTLNILKENDVTISVNGNANSNALKDLGDELDGFYDYFSFTPHIEDRGDYNVTDYTAQMARSAKGLSKADLGACISDIFSTEECDFICISVATDKSALVRKLYKDEMETDEQFIAGATEELFALISEKVNGSGSVGIEISQDEAPEEEKEPISKGKKIALAVLAVILVAAIAACALYFVKFKGKKEEQTTAPTTTAVAETTTKAPEKHQTMTFSELVRYEAVNGFQSSDEKEEDTETTTAGAIDNTAQPEQDDSAAQNTDGRPVQITINGNKVETVEGIARIIEAEMDKSTEPEALKAQAVVVYTYLKYRDTDWSIDNLTIAEAYSQEVYDAIYPVLGGPGRYIAYNDAVAFTPVTRMSAGMTAASEHIFGAEMAREYLNGVDSASDREEDKYQVDHRFTADEIRSAITKYDDGITLGDNSAEWLEIKQHDTAANANVGYVQTIRVGDKELSGYEFIYDVMNGSDLNSTAFNITVNEDGSFTITTFGEGCGVGLSQSGAIKMAKDGKKFDEILAYYYPGTSVVEDAV